MPPCWPSLHQREQILLQQAGVPDEAAGLAQLVLAADSFVVERRILQRTGDAQTKAVTRRRRRLVTDHRRLSLVFRLGRDSMISLPGLFWRRDGLMSRGRFAHLCRIYRWRPDSQPLPRRRQRPGIQHRRRHAMAVVSAARLCRGDRRPGPRRRALAGPARDRALPPARHSPWHCLRSQRRPAGRRARGAAHLDGCQGRRLG